MRRRPPVRLVVLRLMEIAVTVGCGLGLLYSANEQRPLWAIAVVLTLMLNPDRGEM